MTERRVILRYDSHGDLVEEIVEPTPCNCPACVQPTSSSAPSRELVVARGDEDMLLPPGKLCRDCKSFTRCEWLIGCSPTSTMCDWAPSRFRPRDLPLPCRGRQRTS